MPAFGAIAAVIVLAVAIRPAMEKKQAPQHMSNIDSYATPKPEGKAKTADQATASEGAGAAKKLIAKRTAEIPPQPGRGDAKRRSVRPGRESANVQRDQDVRIDLQDGAEVWLRKQQEPSEGRADSVLLDRRMTHADSYGAGARAGVVAATTVTAPVRPSPPSTPAPAQAVVSAGGVDGAPVDSARMRVDGVPSNGAKLIQPNAETVEVLLPSGIAGTEKVPASSMTELIGEDAKRKEARTKPENRVTAEANVIDAFGVKVRIENGPALPFPAPTPLTQQEKLVLAAGRKLKAGAITQNKAGDGKIEIKDIEIKPLEGSEKPEK
jgi:hypothetical protein